MAKAKSNLDSSQEQKKEDIPSLQDKDISALTVPGDQNVNGDAGEGAGADADAGLGADSQENESPENPDPNMGDEGQDNTNDSLVDPPKQDEKKGPVYLVNSNLRMDGIDYAPGSEILNIGEDRANNLIKMGCISILKKGE